MELGVIRRYPETRVSLGVSVGCLAVGLGCSQRHERFCMHRAEDYEYVTITAD